MKANRHELEREFVDEHAFDWCRRVDAMLDMARPFTWARRLRPRSVMPRGHGSQSSAERPLKNALASVL